MDPAVSDAARRSQAPTRASSGSHRSAPAWELRVPWPLRTRRAMVVTLAASLLIPLGAFLVAVALAGDASLREQAIAQSEAAAGLARRAVGTYIDGAKGIVESYALRPSLQAAARARDLEAARRDLREMVGAPPKPDRVFLATPEAGEWVDWPSDPTVLGKSFAQRDWYHGVTATGRIYVSEAYQRAASPRVLLTAIACPVRLEDGTVAAYLVGQFTLRALADWFATLHPTRQGSLVVLDQRGALVLDDGTGRAEPRRLGDGWAPAVADGVDAQAWTGPNPLDGRESVLCLRRIPALGWSVLAHQPLDAVLEPVRALRLWLLALGAALFVALGSVGFVGFETIRRFNAGLLALQAAKDRMTMMVIHDLRNPLTALAGNLDLLDADLPPDALEDRRHLVLASSSARRLRSMADTLVDIVRMEDGNMPLVRARVDLAAVVGGRVAEYAAQAGARSIHLRVALPSGPVAVLGDESMLMRVIENLLTNALKHTPADGAVTLRVEGEPMDPRIRVRVEDTGEGIPAEQLPRIFTKYGRVEGQQMHTRHDTGLGLVFCRLAVELHGGTISVDSDVGRGTVFTIELPAAPSSIGESGSTAGAAASDPGR